MREWDKRIDREFAPKRSPESRARDNARRRERARKKREAKRLSEQKRLESIAPEVDFTATSDCGSGTCAEIAVKGGKGNVCTERKYNPPF